MIISKKVMAMRTLARYMSQRLFSGVRNFSENAKSVEKLHMKQLPKEVKKLTADVKLMEGQIKEATDESIHLAYHNIGTILGLGMYGSISASGGYYFARLRSGKS